MAATWEICLPCRRFPSAGVGKPRRCWDEPSAPDQSRLESDAFFEQQPIQSPTWVVMGQLRGELAPQRAAGIPRFPFDRSTDSFGLEKTITYGRLPSGLVMLNWPLEGNDWHNGLDRCLSADGQVRDGAGPGDAAAQQGFPGTRWRNAATVGSLPATPFRVKTPAWR